MSHISGNNAVVSKIKQLAALAHTVRQSTAGVASALITQYRGWSKVTSSHKKIRKL